MKIIIDIKTENDLLQLIGLLMRNGFAHRDTKAVPFEPLEFGDWVYRNVPIYKLQEIPERRH